MSKVEARSLYKSLDEWMYACQSHSCDHNNMVSSDRLFLVIGAQCEGCSRWFGIRVADLKATCNLPTESRLAFKLREGREAICESFNGRNKMHIISVDFCWDGGTAKIETDVGIYYVDGRMDTWHSIAPREIYDKYPDDKGATIVSSDIRNALLEALKVYHDQCDQTLYGPECILKLIEEIGV